jgi:hypothetical protein
MLKFVESPGREGAEVARQVALALHQEREERYYHSAAKEQSGPRLVMFREMEIRMRNPEMLFSERLVTFPWYRLRPPRRDPGNPLTRSLVPYQEICCPS